MNGMLRILLACGLLLGLAPAAVSAQAPEPPLDAGICAGYGGTFAQDGLGSNICYWIPTGWNQNLVAFAHGYVNPYVAVGIPWDQLFLPDGSSLPAIVQKMGFAFAVTSYHKNGLAVEEGVQDIFSLVAKFRELNPTPTPGRAYLIGASEGGLVTTLALEKDALSRSPVFSGGVSTCGPVGSFTRQINYWSDFRLLFDHYFPAAVLQYTTVPNPVIFIEPGLIAGWTEPAPPSPLPALQTAVVAALQANPTAALTLMQVAQSPVDPADLQNTVAATTLGILGYNILSTDEGRSELAGALLPEEWLTNKGSPYDNNGRTFYDPVAGLIPVQSYTADPDALKVVADHYTTTGRIRAPLVGLHTTGDPIVPYWHEQLYRIKTLQSGSAARFINIPVNRYGHCNFKASEALFAFVVMLVRSSMQMPTLSAVRAALPDDGSGDEFQTLMKANPQLLYPFHANLPVILH